MVQLCGSRSPGRMQADVYGMTEVMPPAGAQARGERFVLHRRVVLDTAMLALENATVHLDGNHRGGPARLVRIGYLLGRGRRIRSCRCDTRRSPDYSCPSGKYCL
jgi:hypothetical protein